MLRIAFAAALAGTILTSPQAPLQAKQPAAAAPAILAWFQGQWEGDVDFIDRQGRGRLLVQPGLGGTATTLDFTADVAAAGDRPAFRFEARGTYRVDENGRVTGIWADSFGNFHALKGQAKDGEFRVTWGDARSEIGHSSYVLSPDGVLTVTDSAFVQGAVRVFGTGKYRKKN